MARRLPAAIGTAAAEEIRVVNDCRGELYIATGAYRSTVSHVIMMDWSKVDKVEFAVDADAGETIIDPDGSPQLIHTYYARFNFLSPKMVPPPGPDRDTYVSTVAHTLIAEADKSDSYFVDKGRGGDSGFSGMENARIANDDRDQKPKPTPTSAASSADVKRTPVSDLAVDAHTPPLLSTAVNVEPCPVTFPAGAQKVAFYQLRSSLAAIEKGGRTSATVRALDFFMQVNNRDAADHAIELCPEHFQVALDYYNSHPNTRALPPRTRLARLDALRQCSTRYAELAANTPVEGSLSGNPFWDEIGRAQPFATLTHRDTKYLSAYRETGYMPVTPEAAASWEKKLGLADDVLQRLCWFWKPAPLFELNNNSYRWHGAHSGATTMPYALKDLPPAVEEAFLPFCHWKKAVRREPLKVQHLDGTTHILKRRGKWTLSGCQKAGDMPRTERVVRETLRSVFGFLTLSGDHPDERMRGLGIDISDLRLSHFFVASNIVAYCKLQEARNGCFDHTGLARLYQDYTLLIGSPESYGRHAQLALLQDLSDVFTPDKTPATANMWEEWCTEQREEVADWISVATNNREGALKFRQARSARSKLQFLLETEQPIQDVIWPTILHIAKNRPPVYYKSEIRYSFEVRLFTLVALTAEPLRPSNWRNMEWGRHLTLRNNSWCISIPHDEFKNRRLLSDSYNSVIDDDARAFFDDFYEVWKIRFGYDPLDKKCPHLKTYVLASTESDGTCSLNEQAIKDRLKDLAVLWGCLLLLMRFAIFGRQTG